MVGIALDLPVEVIGVVLPAYLVVIRLDTGLPLPAGEFGLLYSCLLVMLYSCLLSIVIIIIIIIVEENCLLPGLDPLLGNEVAVLFFLFFLLVLLVFFLLQLLLLLP